MIHLTEREGSSSKFIAHFSKFGKSKSRCPSVFPRAGLPSIILAEWCLEQREREDELSSHSPQANRTIFKIWPRHAMQKMSPSSLSPSPSPHRWRAASGCGRHTWLTRTSPALESRKDRRRSS